MLRIVAIEARHGGTCPRCPDAIEPGQSISNQSGQWVHSTHVTGDRSSGDRQPERRYDNSSSLEDNLDTLIEELSETYEGCIGLEAEFFTTDDYVRTTSLWLRVLDGRGARSVVDGEECMNSKPYLYRVACSLMEQLSIRNFDGERFPDGIWWPESGGSNWY